MTRYEIKSPRPRKDNKTFWMTIGSGFVRDNGGFSLVLDALPIPDKEGRISLLMVEAEQRQGQPRQQERQSGGYGGSSDADDDIPF